MSTELGSDAVILDLDTATYFSVNEVGSFIWAEIREPRRVADICRAVEGSFEVDHASCERDVLAFLSRLEDERLIEVVAPP